MGEATIIDVTPGSEAVPEIVTVPIVGASADDLAWRKAETEPNPR